MTGHTGGKGSIVLDSKSYLLWYTRVHCGSASSVVPVPNDAAATMHIIGTDGGIYQCRSCPELSVILSVRARGRVSG